MKFNIPAHRKSSKIQPQKRVLSLPESVGQERKGRRPNSKFVEVQIPKEAELKDLLTRWCFTIFKSRGGRERGAGYLLRNDEVCKNV